MDKFHLPFFVGFQLGLVRIVILLHILIFDSDVVLEISRTKSDHAHEKFVVAAPKSFIQLVFGNGNAGRKEFFDFVQANLIARQLFNMLLAQSPGPQPVAHEIAELGNIEARLALENRQLPNDIGNFSTAWAKTEALRLMPQDNEVNRKCSITTIARLPKR